MIDFLERIFDSKAINLLSSPQELQEYKITASYQYYNKLQFASPNYENIEFRDRNICHRVDQHTCYVLLHLFTSRFSTEHLWNGLRSLKFRTC